MIQQSVPVVHTSVYLRMFHFLQGLLNIFYISLALDIFSCRRQWSCSHSVFLTWHWPRTVEYSCGKWGDEHEGGERKLEIRSSSQNSLVMSERAFCGESLWMLGGPRRPRLTEERRKGRSSGCTRGIILTVNLKLHQRLTSMTFLICIMVLFVLLWSLQAAVWCCCVYCVLVVLWMHQVSTWQVL